MANSIALDGPDLPAGFKGNLNQFLNFLRENWGGTVQSGEGVIPGQIGGPQPTTNIGIWISGKTIYVWDDASATYVTATDVPVGSIIPWAGPSNAADPTNYMLCDGRTLSTTDTANQLLFAAIGFTWGKVSDTSFKIPDMRGRTIVGSGTGDYADNNDISTVGSITNRVVGTYFGFEWLVQSIRKQTGAPTKTTKIATTYLANGTQTTFTGAAMPSMVCRGLIRIK